MFNSTLDGEELSVMAEDKMKQMFTGEEEYTLICKCCKWHLRDGACKPICPDCRQPLFVVSGTEEETEEYLIKEGYLKRK